MHRLNSLSFVERLSDKKKRGKLSSQNAYEPHYVVHLTVIPGTVFNKHFRLHVTLYYLSVLAQNDNNERC